MKFLSRLGILFAILAVALNWSIVNTAIPAMQESLKASLTQMQWLMNAFGLALVPFLVTVGRLGDLYGRKKLYIIGSIVFTIASAWGGLTEGIAQLIISRALQGIGAAILLPLSQALIIDEYPRNKKGHAIGIWMLTIGLGCGLGPLLGGTLISLLSWKWIFFINLPFTIGAIILCSLFTSENKDTTSSKTLDIPGNLTLIISLAALIFAIVQGPDWGWDSAIIITLFSVSFIGCILFYFIEKHSKEPIIEFSFFINERFLSSALAVFFAIFFTWGTFFLMPIYLQNVLDYTPFLAGIVLLLITFPFVIVSPIVGKIEHKIRPKIFILLGTFLCGCSAAISLFFTTQTSIIPIIFCFMAFGLGWGVMFGPCVTAGISTLPPEKSGLAAGSLNTLQETGGSLGLAICGSILRNVNTEHVKHFIKNNNISLPQKSYDTFINMISNPSEVKAYLTTNHPELLNSLLPQVNEGFMEGLHMSMGALLGFSAFVFLFVVIFMRKPQAPQVDSHR